MSEELAPVAKAAMLIRRPVGEVFEAFVDPEVTSQFWFTRGSDRLAAGKHVTWTWEMYGVSSDVAVKTVELNKRIVVDWYVGGATTTIEWSFLHDPDGTTFVSIENRGFEGTGAERAAQAIAATEGFTLVLAGLKALLEQDVRLDLVRDRFPEGLAT